MCVCAETYISHDVTIFGASLCIFHFSMISPPWRTQDP